MPRNAYYYYDQDTCAFVEVQPKKSRYVWNAAAVVATACLLAALGLWAAFNRIQTPEEIVLRQENEALRDKLRENNQRFDAFASRLDVLAEHDRDLYRTLFQAEPIPEDVRKVGVGGTADERFDGFSEPTARLMRTNAEQLDRLERQMGLQTRSYDELLGIAKGRSEMLAEMPAMLPAHGVLTSGFGVRFHPIHRLRKMHAGVDFSVPVGTPVYATGAGVVQFAGVSSGYGRNVVIRHGKAQRLTRYAHLSEIEVKVGQRVERGDVIAKSGNSGLSTAPHLHYEVRKLNNELLNPIYSLAPGVEPAKYQEMVLAAQSENAPLD